MLFSSDPEPVHAVDDVTMFFHTPKNTHCGIDLVNMSKKDLRDVVLALDEDDEVTCEDCLRALRGGFFAWLGRVLFGR